MIAQSLYAIQENIVHHQNETAKKLAEALQNLDILDKTGKKREVGSQSCNILNKVHEQGKYTWCQYEMTYANVLCLWTYSSIIGAPKFEFESKIDCWSKFD